jgi:zinc transporter ZupT
MGAAFGILLAYVVQGILRAGVLRFVFRWQNPWNSLRAPVFTAVVALIPALICRLFLDRMTGQITAGLVLLAVFGAGWMYHLRSSKLA